MRFIPFLCAIACSEYDLQTIVDKSIPVDGAVETHSDGTAGGVPSELTEEGALDDTGVESVEEELVDPGECNGFVIDQPLSWPDVETESYALFTLVSDPEIEVRQGETVRFMFAITAHECGDVVLNGFKVVQVTVDSTPASWVTAVEHSGQTSTVANLSGETQFVPTDGYNITSDDYDSRIYYGWQNYAYDTSIQGVMEEVYVEAATTEILVFTFTATDYIESGTSFDLYLLDPTWVDVGTGSEALDFGTESVSIRVTIIE